MFTQSVIEFFVNTLFVVFTSVIFLLYPIKWSLQLSVFNFKRKLTETRSKACIWNIADGNKIISQCLIWPRGYRCVNMKSRRSRRFKQPLTMLTPACGVSRFGVQGVRRGAFARDARHNEKMVSARKKDGRILCYTRLGFSLM